MFEQLLNYYNSHFVVTKPIFDNMQPSNMLEYRIMKALFFDEMLDLVPHTKSGTVNGFQEFSQLILSTAIGRIWPTSSYKFVNELDYITTMKSVNFNVEPTHLSAKQLFDSILDNYIGYGLITKTKKQYVIDTRYLQKFEIRDGYSKLDTIVYLDDKMHFGYCKINGIRRTDDLAIRECVAAVFTIMTIEKHLFTIHLLISDQSNILLNTTDRSTPVYRILTPFTHDPYSINESGSITLLGQTGVCNWFNFTRAGLGQYYESTMRDFKIRDLLIPKKMPGNSAVHKHQHLWFNCIRKFVNEFMSVQKALNCDDFVKLLKTNYNGICDDCKTKFENVVDICTMMIYSTIIHETCSNPSLSKFAVNPFTVSTTWRQNDSLELADKVNNLGEQTAVNFMAYISSLEAIRIDDVRWMEMCCVNEEEKRIYKRFLKSIADLDIPEDAILHPKNLSSSISY